MDAKEPKPDSKDAPKKELIVLEYGQGGKEGLLIRNNNVPTIALGGILALAAVTPPVALPDSDDGRKIEVEYDYATDACEVRTDASPIIARGMFYMAQMMMIQVQLLGMFQKMQAAAARPKIHKPGLHHGVS